MVAEFEYGENVLPKHQGFMDFTNDLTYFAIKRSISEIVILFVLLIRQLIV